MTKTMPSPIAGASHEESWTFSCPPTQPYSGSSNPPPARHWRAHPCPPALPYHLSSLLTISSPSHADSSLRTMTAHMAKPWEHLLRAPRAPLCRLHAASERRCPHVCPWATDCATARSTSRPEGEYTDTRTRCTMMGCQCQTGKSKPPTGKGGGSDPLTQTDNHMHHTSITIVILGKHIATMLRHNPYSLLRSTARTNLVERSYSQFFFFPIIIYNFFY